MGRPRKGEETGWKKDFLIALAMEPYVSRACTAANISRSRAYAAKKQDQEFSDAWDDALNNGLDQIEWHLFQIGIGKEKGQYGALIYLLKARRYEVKSGQELPSKIVFEWGSNGDLPTDTAAQLGSNESNPLP